MLTGEVLNLFATPSAYMGERGGAQSVAKRIAGKHSVNLEDQIYDVGHALLPSPMAADSDRESLVFPRGNPTLKGALLPTPSVATATGGQTSRSGSRSDERLLGGLAVDMAVEWGVYEPAIRRWEYIRGIEAPCPVEMGQKGNPRLAPLFVEWMMGLPPGWVTGIEGLSRAKQLKLLGNGVVPQQAYYALRSLLWTLSLME
jgi:DNA (cytosine-5)-methyltransferase 1